MNLERKDRFRLHMPRQGAMKTDATIYLHESMSVEREALEQVRDAASIDPAAVVLATPDIHTGFGVPIGSVLASPELVSPAAVGYDINCGMRLLLTSFFADEVPVERLADAIAADLPLGEGKRNPRFALSERDLKRVLADGVPGLLDLARAGGRVDLDPEEIASDIRRIEDGGRLAGDTAAVSARALERGAAQLGTLGGGNHFVEIQRVARIDDEPLARALGLFAGQAVVMIHSGSRGLGHEVAGDAMRSSSRAAARLGLFLPNSQLTYVPADSAEGRAYLGAMGAAANFAFANRQAIAAIVRRAAARVLRDGSFLPTVYDVSHNIAKVERHDGRLLHVHRKGATRAFSAALMRGTDFAQIGQPVLIPGSMGTASYVLVGADSGKEALYSVNHGAGRVMSRTAAAGRSRHRKGRGDRQGLITDRRFAESMRGIHLVCEDRHSIKEEAPDAYKDVDRVVETVVGAGLARVVARLVPLAVLKG